MTKTRGMTSVDTIQIDDFPWVLAPGEFGYWKQETIREREREIETTNKRECHFGSKLIRDSGFAGDDDVADAAHRRR